MWLLPPPMEDDDDGSADDDEVDDGTVQESMDDETVDGRDDSPPITIQVLPWNVAIVDVFQNASPDLRVGLSVRSNGITSTEIRDTALMLHVPERDWPRTLYGVKRMGEIAAAVFNDKADKAAERARAKSKRDS